jgi:hypothetical protein
VRITGNTSPVRCVDRWTPGLNAPDGGPEGEGDVPV